MIPLGRYDFDTVKSGPAFGPERWRWTSLPLNLDRGDYEVWLNARYDASESTLVIERPVARRQR